MGDAGWRTLREIDEQLRLPKGSAFRAFKRAALEDGADFRVLVPGTDDAELHALRDTQRIYRSSVNVVLLSPRGAAAVRHALER